jgi:hypothetical protein
VDLYTLVAMARGALEGRNAAEQTDYQRQQAQQQQAFEQAGADRAAAMDAQRMDLEKTKFTFAQKLADLQEKRDARDELWQREGQFTAARERQRQEYREYLQRLLPAITGSQASPDQVVRGQQQGVPAYLGITAPSEAVLPVTQAQGPTLNVGGMVSPTKGPPTLPVAPSPTASVASPVSAKLQVAQPTVKLGQTRANQEGEFFSPEQVAKGQMTVSRMPGKAWESLDTEALVAEAIKTGQVQPDEQGRLVYVSPAQREAAMLKQRETMANILKTTTETAAIGTRETRETVLAQAKARLDSAQALSELADAAWRDAQTAEIPAESKAKIALDAANAKKALAEAASQLADAMRTGELHGEFEAKTDADMAKAMLDYRASMAGVNVQLRQLGMTDRHYRALEAVQAGNASREDQKLANDSLQIFLKVAGVGGFAGGTAGGAKPKYSTPGTGVMPPLPPVP